MWIDEGWAKLNIVGKGIMSLRSNYRYILEQLGKESEVGVEDIGY